MTCSACGHTLPERAKFCPDCGLAMAPRCASCGVELPAAAKFCAECGSATGAIAGARQVTEEERPVRDVLAYTPKHLADRILQSRSALEGERKEVSILFADVKSSMELAEQVGAEAWHELLDRFFEILSDGVHRFEGTVNQYTGDGIMALFGAPIAHEDHAQRACFAGKALYPIAEYSFKHPLTQAVAQDSLLGERRRALHAAVARALEAAGGDLDEQAALLAHHFEAAGEARPAAEWHRRAAEWIAGSNATEATRHWQRVRALADEIEDAALASELGERSRVMILEYAWRLGISQQEADELLHEGEAWAQRQSSPHALASLYNASAIGLALGPGQLTRAREMCAEGLHLAREAGDEPLSFV